MNTKTLERLGWCGVAAAVLGVLSAGVMMAWPPAVPEGVLSYPFSTEGFRTIQTWFFFHHLLLVAVAVGFSRSSEVGGSVVARVGAWLAVAGLVGLTGMELFAMRFAEWGLREANEGVMGKGYGMTTSLVGLGMLLAGAVVARRGVWPRAVRFAPLLIGLTHFLLVTPALFSYVYVAARLAIGTWIALFGLLGWGLVVEARRARDAFA